MFARRDVHKETSRMKAPVEPIVDVLYRHKHIFTNKPTQLANVETKKKVDKHAMPKPMEDTEDRTEGETEDMHE